MSERNESSFSGSRGPALFVAAEVGGSYLYGLRTWALVLGALGLLVWVMHEDLAKLLSSWRQDEYSYGYFLPLVFAFFFWQRWSKVVEAPVRHAWIGLVVGSLGLIVYWIGELGSVIGELGAVPKLVQYAFLIAVAGIAISLLGWPAFRTVAPGYLLLFFAVPLPGILYTSLSAELQLVSSQLGVFFIRLFGIAVHLEGNVIDLGVYKLQVADACSGLRYLFPLVTLGYVAAHFFRGAVWKKTVLVLAPVPIAILMNGLRIGVIGLLVEHRGIAHAEGFIHDFEGWLMFMASAALLSLLMAALAKVGREPMRLRDAFAIERPQPNTARLALGSRSVPAAFFALLVPWTLGALAVHAIPRGAELVPERTEFLFFPSRIGEWQGRVDRIDPVYEEVLKADDYLLSDFSTNRGERVNLWIAYYESQRMGASVHSPRMCLPGGGWEMQVLSEVELPGVRVWGQPLRVNRVVVQSIERRELVYYWFQQRGRLLTNEWLGNRFLSWDAVTRQRTDGALVRLTTPIGPAGLDDLAEADARLTAFARGLSGKLAPFIPE